MRRRLPSLVRTTTFRLVLLNSAMFAVFVLGLLIYLYATTFGFIRADANRRISAELTELTTAYRTGGLLRLNESVLERRSVPGLDRFFYLLVNAEGQKIQGDFDALPVAFKPGGPTRVFFPYEVPLQDGSVRVRSAEGRLALLDDGSTLFVAYDSADNVELQPRIARAVWTAAPIGLLMSLLGGILISRTAARRADELARTAEAVMGGDLSRRAPVVGSRDEFDRLAERQNAMLERIETLMQSARYVGDSIAHDLRSPLTRLRNNLEEAQSERLDPVEARRVLGQTLDEVDQVLTTFNAILRLSRLQAGEGGHLSLVNASEIAEEVAELYAPACEEAELTFEAKIDNHLPVLGDRGLLAQAFANLLDNGVKYTPAKGSLIFEAHRGRSGDILVSVSDSGPGIPAAERERVKDRFVRLEQSRSEPGSGLGLSLVDAVAELHSGSLMLEDAGGPSDRPGLKAILRLPRA